MKRQRNAVNHMRDREGAWLYRGVPQGPRGVETARVMCLSTLHLPLKVRQDIELGGLDVAYMESGFGWLIAASKRVLWRCAEHPDGHVLEAIIRAAIERGCRYVLFDVDVPVTDLFPTFAP